MMQIEISLYNGKKLFLQKGESFFRLLTEEGILGNHCNGKGRCHKCRVRFLENAPIPTQAERNILKPGELREGIRLACMTNPTRSCRIMPLLQDIFMLDSFSIDMTRLGDVPQGEIIVADVGTTTIIMLLIERKSGRIIRSFQKLNPQRKYGSDVISRLEAGLDGKEEELSSLVKEVLLEGIQCLGGSPAYMALAGNTTMIYLLMNYPLTGLSQEPFLAVNPQITTEIGIPTVIMPGISAFLGGDMRAGLYAILAERNKRNALFLDFGTNGEIALLTKDDIYVTAAAMGSAFEEISQLWGADLINVVAQFLDKGIIDEYGTMQEPYHSEGILIDRFCLRQENIRQLQLAKAALRTGIEILCKQAGLAEDSITRVYIAGAFGHFIDVEKAGKIGLIPPGLAKKARFVGNTSLAGTFLYYRDYDINVENTEYKEIPNIISYNLAKLEEFEEIYLKNLNFDGQ